MSNYAVVGYAGKSGIARAYKLIGKCQDKFTPGRERAHLVSIDGKLDFWVDAARLTDPPPQSEMGRRRSGCNCDMDCCSPCECDARCNCRGGNIYDC